MLACPNCRVPLENNHVRAAIFAACPKCGGSFVPIQAVRDAVRADIQAKLLDRVRASEKQGTQPCPKCGLPMEVAEVPRGPKPVELEVCNPCGCVWFDPRKYDALREIYGLEEPPKHMVDRKWKWAAALVGMPVEQQTPALLAPPRITWILAGIITLTSVTGWLRPAMQDRLALVPAEAWRLGGATLLTCFFLHGGLFHLASNMYFLIVFGKRVEDYLGWKQYLLLLLLATLAGSVLHVALNSASFIPTVGASGGISGAIVFYGLQFPRVRLLILTPELFFYPVRLRAWIALVIWILLQIVGAWEQVNGFSDVASLGHLGGAAIGLLFWLKWRSGLEIRPAPAS